MPTRHAALPFVLSSRPERSGGEGPAVPLHPQLTPSEATSELHHQMLAGHAAPPLCCHTDWSAPGFPATRPSPAPTRAAFRKESRMKFANATNPNRKSGVAEGRDLQFHSTRN